MPSYATREERVPLVARCRKSLCEEEWAVAYLPMHACDFRDAVQHVTCPACGSHAYYADVLAQVRPTPRVEGVRAQERAG